MRISSRLLVPGLVLMLAVPLDAQRPEQALARNLLNLESVVIRCEILADAGGSGSLDTSALASRIQSDAESRVRGANLRALTPKEAGETTPSLRITLRVLTVPGEKLMAVAGDIELLERAVLVRAPDTPTYAFSWGASTQAVAGEKRLGDVMRLMASDLIDNFIASYRAANRRE